MNWLDWPPPRSRLESLDRGPRPLARVCWIRFDDDNRVRLGRGAELVPIGVGRWVVDRLVESAYCDAWIEVEGRVG
jgi:hypothetical protein